VLSQLAQQMLADLGKQKQATFNKEEEAKRVEDAEKSLYGFDDY